MPTKLVVGTQELFHDFLYLTNFIPFSVFDFDIFLTDVWRNEVMGRGEGEVAPDALSCPRPAFPRLCRVHQNQRGPV